jgi:hypothetical protein
MRFVIISAALAVAACQPGAEQGNSTAPAEPASVGPAQSAAEGQAMADEQAKAVEQANAVEQAGGNAAADRAGGQ